MRRPDPGHIVHISGVHQQLLLILLLRMESQVHAVSGDDDSQLVHDVLHN